MSKWIKKDAFAVFREKIKEDESKAAKSDFNGRWDTPEKGKQDKPNVYELRLIPDPNGSFYKKILYHMFKVDDKWIFTICPKSFDMENWCSCCATSSKLYTGTEADKKDATLLKRKEKYVVNAFIVEDPRDEDKDADKKVTNTVKLYEFPGKVEALIRAAMTDDKNGVGIGAFDPSEEGYNFILKVGATKPDGDGKTWPDYSLSSFARRPSPLAESDKEIEEILSKAYVLDDYLKTLEKDEKDLIKALKSLGFFDLISSDYQRIKGIVDEDNEKSSKTSKSVETESITEQKVTQSKTTSKQESTDLDDELLKELESL